MARYSMQIHQVHIVDGFVDDCDELLQHCRQVKILTYEIFTEIWKGMGFAYLYKNRASHVEVAEMSEEFLHVAKRYMVANTSNYEDSVMGLFLVYALLNLQPYPGFAALRITPDDVLAITRIESVARRDRRFDVLRVLGSVLIEGPCIYTIVDRARGMETGFRKYYEGYTTMDSQGIRPRGVFYRQNTELDLIREMITLDKRYSEAKKGVTGVNKSDASLSYTDSNLPQVMENSLKKVINGLFAAEETVPQSSEKDLKEPTETEEHYDVVQRIKMKAMKSTVDTMNHLRGVQERNKQKRTKRKSVEINEGGGNVKSSSPQKLTKSGSPKKRNAPKAVSSKKKKIKMEHGGDSFDKDGLRDRSSSDNDPITDEEDLLPPVDLELEKVDKSNSDDNIQENCEKANTGLESLPILVNAGNHEYIEIEVIDEANPSNNANKLTASDILVTSNDNEYIEIEVIDALANNETTLHTDNKNASNSENLGSASVESKTAVSELHNEEILKRINELPHLSIERVPVKDNNLRSKASIVLNSYKNDDELFKKPRAVKTKESKSKPIVNKRDQKKSKPKLKKK